MDPILKVSEIIDIYESLEDWTEFCINREDIVNASKCKTEILQLMTKGAKWKVVIPSDLAYGDRGAGGAIAPGATLVFEIDLLDIKPAVVQ